MPGIFWLRASLGTLMCSPLPAEGHASDVLSREMARAPARVGWAGNRAKQPPQLSTSLLPLQARKRERERRKI